MIDPASLRAHLHDAERRAGLPGAAAVLLDVAAGVRAVASLLRRGVLAGAGGEDPRGERWRRADAAASALLLDALARGGHVAAVASAAAPEPHLVPGAGDARLVVAMDPLDGAADLEANAAVGSVFSVLRRPEGGAPGAADFLQPGARQACAAYALYGPGTVLVVALGGEVDGFTLDPATGEFVLSHPRLRVPGEGARAGAPAEPAARRGGSAAAEVHRVLVRGGAFLSPREDEPGALRLLSGAAPLALVLEQAGGAAAAGGARLLDLAPRRLDERVRAALGARREVERLAARADGREAALDRPYRSPLFGARTLLREW